MRHWSFSQFAYRPQQASFSVVSQSVSNTRETIGEILNFISFLHLLFEQTLSVLIDGSPLFVGSLFFKELIVNHVFILAFFIQSTQGAV